MNKQSNAQDQNREDWIIQDGVSCPRTSPWPSSVSKLTRLLFIPVIVLPVYILVQTSIPKLILWLVLFGIFAYPLRYLVCARCPYYGQACSTDLGRIVPGLFKKQEGKSMRLGLWLDVVFFAILFLLPLPQVWEYGGILMLLLWCALFFSMFAGLTRLACSACPFTFCPIGKAGRALWSKHG